MWDSDWFAADLTAGRSYRIEILGPGGANCTLLAPIIESILDASGEIVPGTAWDDSERDDVWPAMTFTPDTDGTHYISVVGEGHYWGRGTYIVALTDGGAGHDDRISAIGAQGCLPAAPSSLGTSEVTHQSITLSWTAPSHSGVRGYRILRGADAASLAVLVSDTGDTATRYVDTGVSPSTAYAVVALSATEAGNPSAAASTPAQPATAVDGQPDSDEGARVGQQPVSLPGRPDCR